MWEISIFLSADAKERRFKWYMLATHALWTGNPKKGMTQKKLLGFDIGDDNDDYIDKDIVKAKKKRIDEILGPPLTTEQVIEMQVKLRKKG